MFQVYNLTVYKRVMSFCKYFVYFFIIINCMISATTKTLPRTLKNTYWGLRHGQSESNVEGIISSGFLKGTSGHGLTVLGRQQSEESGISLMKEVGVENVSSTYFYSSIFLRARQTTESCISSLINNLHEQNIHVHRPSYKIRTTLRERCFGTLDQQDLVLYNDVWPVDAVNADNKEFDIESVNEVVQRLNMFIEEHLLNEIEAHHNGHHIVIVSHADTLQIMQTYMCGEDVRNFSQYRFKNGEVRNMSILPPPNPVKSDK